MEQDSSIKLLDLNSSQLLENTGAFLEINYVALFGSQIAQALFKCPFMPVIQIWHREMPHYTPLHITFRPLYNKKFLSFISFNYWISHHSYGFTFSYFLIRFMYKNNTLSVIHTYYHRHPSTPSPRNYISMLLNSAPHPVRVSLTHHKTTLKVFSKGWTEPLLI